MLNHALKLVWNRRRANFLVVVEIAAAFVVTFVLLALAVNLWSNFRRPLGFEFQNIWSVAVSADEAGMGSFPFGDDEISDTLADVTARLRALARVQAVEPIAMPPFVNFVWDTRLGADADNLVSVNINRTTSAGLQAIGVSLVEGRWFSAEDEGQDYRAALVNRAFVERVFGTDASVIGRQISFPDPSAPLQQVPQWQATEAQRAVRVIGVVEDFRQWGEFVETRPYALQLHEDVDARGASFNLLLKVTPGTDAGFEEDVIAAVESVAAGWTAAVTPWQQLRAQTHASTLLPIKIASTLAVFFIALVVMGLIGVLWQDVVRRTQEIGLRRALGADAGTVRRQIQLEMLVLGLFGILIGAAVAIQFPLLEIIEDVDWAAALPALVLAALLIVSLVLLGAQYPSWLASRREPADALRYE
ncbi:MAG TPA: ABC transporter permease [Gammaproteobacteria bacterium]|nr:ABC transporter permease [Gammaproteobacteria bacterium]